MTLDEYVTRYRFFQLALEKDERALKLVTSERYRTLLSRFGESDDPALSRLFLTKTQLEGRIRHRRRLCEAYAKRLAGAIEQMDSPVLREFSTLHYLFGMTYETVAETTGFAVRTVYRHAKKAKEAFARALLQVMPSCKRTAPARFRADRVLLPRKNPIDKMTSALAQVAARRRYAAPITAGTFYREGRYKKHG